MNADYDGPVAHVAGSPVSGEAAWKVVSVEDFDQAWTEITAWPGYSATPLHTLPSLAGKLGITELRYKDEGPRFGLGSFKALGGAYAALRVLHQQTSVRSGDNITLADIALGRAREHCGGITLSSATDGNHGRSLAWGCQRFGAPCRIYIHAEVSEGRAEAMRALGAEVVRIDGDYDASVALSRDEAAENGWFVISDTSWPGYTEPPRDVMAGYGVMVREACEAMKQPPTHVFLQGGVGGMAGATAAALRQYWRDDAPRVVVVEPDRAACLIASAGAGELTNVDVKEETIMAGLSCGEPSPLAWQILAEESSDFLAIPDSMVAPAMRLLARPYGHDPVIHAGESAVAGLAGMIAACGRPPLARALGLNARSRVLVFGTEGITDPEIYSRIMRGANA